MDAIKPVENEKHQTFVDSETSRTLLNCRPGIQKRVAAHTGAIDFQTEEVVALRDAAKMLPPRHGGKNTHVSSLYRWAGKGLRGVRLDTIKIGSVVCTSSEALQRFFERLSASDDLESDAPVYSTPSQTLRDAERAGRELDKMGVTEIEGEEL